VSFNKGYASGFEKNHPRRHRLVYVPLYRPDVRAKTSAERYIGYAQCIPDDTNKTADVAVTLTDSIAGEAGMPADGSLRGVRVELIGLNSTAIDTTLIVYDYDTGSYGGELKFGKVANLYDAQMMDLRTDGQGRFWYALGWNSGTSHLYMRAMGYFREAN
jgi:hypothetical protein